MIPALLTRLRTSALYLLVLVLLFAASTRALFLAVPMIQRADTAERQLEPFDRQAYADDAMQTTGREQTLAKIAATHRHSQELNRASYRALLPVMGYFALLMLGLMVYKRSESQKTANVVFFFSSAAYFVGLLVIINWPAIRGVLRVVYRLTADLFTSPRPQGASMLLLALLAGAALCYDVLRPRKAPPVDAN
jgi:uncharacterized membrane protein YeiB